MRRSAAAHTLLAMSCVGASLLVLTACGRSDGGSDLPGTPGGSPNTPLPPVTHVLAQSQPVTISAGGTYGFSFRLPRTASLHFSASETTTDTWNVAVYSASQWASYLSGGDNVATDGIHNRVMQVSDTVTLPAGEWYLGWTCTNTFQRCMFVFNAEATY